MRREHGTSRAGSDVGRWGPRKVAVAIASIGLLAITSIGLTSAPAFAAAPDAPQNVTTDPGDAQVVVSWDAPASDGGSAITGYAVTADPGAATCTTGGATSCTVSGLTNGTPYTFTVTATNSLGTSAASAPSGAVIPAALPSAPTLVAATLGDRRVRLDWTAPTSDGGLAVSGYTVTCTSETAPTRVVVVNKPFLGTTVAGLTAGSTYSCTVAARQSSTRPYGPASAPMTVEADRAPGVPTSMVMSPGDGQFTVGWGSPVPNGSSPVLSYSLACTYLVNGVPTPISVSGPIVSPVTVTGVSNGTAYQCKLRASNVIGASSPASRSVTPRTVPGTPTSVAWTAGSGSATLSFVPPTATGGSRIMGYTVECVSGATTRIANLSASATSGRIGLSNGVTYECSIAARNAAGTGVPSATTEVLPLTIPNAPSGLAAAAGVGSVTLSFNPSVGSVVDTYTAVCTSSVAGAASPVSAGGSSGPLTVTGLTGGALYGCTVVATNVMGTSPLSRPVFFYALTGP